MTDTCDIGNYLSELRRNLEPATLDEREEILREIQAHIRDASEQGTSAGEVLARLGPPEELAAQYREGLLIRRASRSFSPLTLLCAAARVATKGAAGIVVFIAGLLGYVLGIGLMVGALLKPFFPGHIGVFVSESTSSQAQIMQPDPQVVQTITATSARSHEILGIWVIPVFLVLGALALLATTLLIRAVLRLSHRWQMRLQS